MPTHHHSEGTSFPALTWPHLDDHRPVDQAPTNHSSTGQTRVEMTASRTPSSSQNHAWTKKHRWAIPALLQVLAMIGIGAILYSNAADWFATRHHGSEISGYVDSVEQLPSAERIAEAQRAREYNAHLPQGVLRDPYLNPPDAEEEDAAYAAYQQILQISDNGVIGELRYPRLGIGLPIYHGTSDDVLARGVGHLYGSSLPVGGPSTHSVLTSHSGLVHASLFSPLPRAAVGDTFRIEVLGDEHYYRVESVETVLPEATESLQIIAGEEHVTLVTCTPIGVNTHRLLVHGIRIALPDDVGLGSRPLTSHENGAGFPWWLLWFGFGSGAVAFILFSPPRARSNYSPREAYS